MSLHGYKVLLFDCYGTLINWEQGMLDNLGPLLEQQAAPSRSKLFEVLGPNETRIQTESPTMLYPEVLGSNATTANSATKFGQSVGSWPAFSDSAEALKRLHDLGLKLVILSNVNNDSFAGSRKKLESSGGTFDAVHTAENIGSYKPSLRNFEYALKHVKEDFGAEKEEVLIVANSKLHDVAPGQKMGLKSAWINRPSAVMGVAAYSDVAPDWTFDSMADFAEVVAAARA